MSELKNKTIVITGATSGIGYQAALDFAQSGAFVIGTGRSTERCVAAAEKVNQLVPGAQVFYCCGDFASQAEVRTLAKDIQNILKEHGKPGLDLLVNNAGMVNDHKVLTSEAIERTFAVNHLAPFLLTHLLLPQLSAQAGARVLTVSSNSHYNTWFHPKIAKNPPLFIIFWAYKVSKLSNVLFTAEFNRRRKEYHPRAFAVDPGLVNTDIGLKGTGSLASRVWKGRQKIGDHPEKPVKTLLHLAGELTENEIPKVYWKDCLPKKPSRAAFNQDLARRLWDESCNLCAIKDYFNPEGLQ